MTDTTAPTPTPAPAPMWPRRRRGFLFPLLLILAGAFFFLGNLGYLPPVSWHGILSLWPLLLVLWGIEIVVGRRQPYLALALELAVVVAGVGLVAMQPYGFLAPLSGTTAGSSFTVPRGSVQSLQLRVDGGAGTYTVQGGASSLVEASSQDGEITLRDNGGGDVRIQPRDNGDVFRMAGTPPTHVDVRVASDVPASVRVSGGAGDFTVDLSGIRTRDARLDTGASRLQLTLPEPVGDVPVTVNAGAASVVIVVPDGVETSIRTTGGLISVNSVNPRVGTGTRSVVGATSTTYETPGYANAADRVTVTVSAGASSITIR